jgi:hypothetical protein
MDARIGMRPDHFRPNQSRWLQPRGGGYRIRCRERASEASRKFLIRFVYEYAFRLRFPQSVIIDDSSLPTFDDPRLAAGCHTRFMLQNGPGSCERLPGQCRALSRWDKLNRELPCPR